MSVCTFTGTRFIGTRNPIDKVPGWICRIERQLIERGPAIGRVGDPPANIRSEAKHWKGQPKRGRTKDIELAGHGHVKRMEPLGAVPGIVWIRETHPADAAGNTFPPKCSGVRGAVQRGLPIRRPAIGSGICRLGWRRCGCELSQKTGCRLEQRYMGDAAPDIILGHRTEPGLLAAVLARGSSWAAWWLNPAAYPRTSAFISGDAAVLDLRDKLSGESR